ncbi:MAG: hypothetical protein H6657_11045 [Ardenticatenaceae bacterium]|nr:hypothetical protein [Ardenticatenaceae bacterium]
MIEPLGNELRQEAAVIEEAFVCLDECINQLQAVDSSFSRVCILTLIKARNLILGMYSLALDGLAQEAGAILRPLIGTIEKLSYFRKDPQHVEQALDDNLPTEGKIAKVIDGEFKFLRDYLSKFASHSNFSFESLKHLINLRDFSLRIVQTYDEKVFRGNLEMVFAFLIISVMEGQKCLASINRLDQGFASYVSELRFRGFSVLIDN